MVVVLLGPPGVGKGTQAIRMARDLGAAHVSTGDLLRDARRDGTELGARAQSYMDRGELVPDELILDLVRSHLGTVSPSAPVLFDGFPRTTAQAEGLRATLERSDRRLDLVVLFEASDETLVKRLSGRRTCSECGTLYNEHFSPPASPDVCDRCGGRLLHRADDDPETVERRLEVYHAQTAPLVEYYEADPAPLVRIRADRGVEDVYSDFRAVLETVER